VEIGHKLQSLGKISNISAADPPVLLGQFQHWATVGGKLLIVTSANSDRLFQYVCGCLGSNDMLNV